MTGFGACGRVDAADLRPGLHWAWEAKSVNGRNLEVRAAPPPGFESRKRSPRRPGGTLQARQRRARALTTLARGGEPPRARINREPLDQLMAPRCRVRGRARRADAARQPRFAVRGVVEVVEEAEPSEEQRAVRLTRA
jgi:uncharacterized protein YicC (UPF0701 family)